MTNARSWSGPNIVLVAPRAPHGRHLCQRCVAARQCYVRALSTRVQLMNGCTCVAVTPQPSCEPHRSSASLTGALTCSVCPLLPTYPRTATVYPVMQACVEDIGSQQTANGWGYVRGLLGLGAPYTLVWLTWLCPSNRVYRPHFPRRPVSHGAGDWLVQHQPSYESANYGSAVLAG